MDHLFLGWVFLEEVVGNVVIAERKQSDDTRPGANNVPAELVARPLPVCTDTQDCSQNSNSGSVAQNDGVVGILLRDVGILLCALLRLLLGSLRLGGGLLGLSFELDALGLRVGLYGLLLEVGGHRGNVGRVDINERGDRVVGTLDDCRGGSAAVNTLLVTNMGGYWRQ